MVIWRDICYMNGSPAELDVEVLLPDGLLVLVLGLQHEEVVEDEGADAPGREEDEEGSRVAVQDVLRHDREQDYHQRCADPVRGSRIRHDLRLHDLRNVEPHHGAEGETKNCHEHEKAGQDEPLP